MTAGVISDKRPSRKRALARGWTMGRFIAVALAFAALIAVIWVAPYLRPSPLKYPEPAEVPSAATFPELPLPVATEAPAPAPQQPRTTRRRDTGIPLDATPAPVGEDYEVLSASELAGISQARDE